MRRRSAHLKNSDHGAELLLQRFVREIQVWSKLTNKHILSFYGIVTDQGKHMHMVGAGCQVRRCRLI